MCIEYDEKQSQPIHSIAKTVLDDENEGPEYNRITEGYSLYITDEEPEKFMCESENLALKRKNTHIRWDKCFYYMSFNCKRRRRVYTGNSGK